MADEPKRPIGHWTAYVAGPAIGWDTTVLGIAIYDPDGELAYSRFVSIEKAIARGDWGRDWTAPALVAPPNWVEMEKTLERFGNAMSQLRWAGGNPTLVWDAKTGDSLFETIVGVDKTGDEPIEDPGDLKKGIAAGKGKPSLTPPGQNHTPRTVPDLVEEIAHLVEIQPLLSDLSLAMGDMVYHQELAAKIRKQFVSVDTRVARTRLEADTYAVMINEILEAMCVNQGVSTISPYDPNKRAPNFVLAQRLGIGRVFDIPDLDDEWDQNIFQHWAKDWDSPEDETNIASPTPSEANSETT